MNGFPGWYFSISFSVYADYELRALSARGDASGNQPGVRSSHSGQARGAPRGVQDSAVCVQQTPEPQDALGVAGPDRSGLCHHPLQALLRQGGARAQRVMTQSRKEREVQGNQILSSETPGPEHGDQRSRLKSATVGTRGNQHPAAAQVQLLGCSRDPLTSKRMPDEGAWEVHSEGVGRESLVALREASRFVKGSSWSHDIEPVYYAVVACRQTRVCPNIFPWRSI